MDSVDMCAALSTEDGNLFIKKKRDWHKRLRLRKTAIQPPTMQGRDKPGPKKIAKERGPNVDCPSSSVTSHKAQQSQRKVTDGSSTLRFRCSKCTDNLEFVPVELVRHFQEAHKGSLPDFSCHVCSFSAHEFSYLQVHLLSHKDTFASCNICNDNVQRTLSEYCSHLTTRHSQNGKFSCELCETFSTSEVHVFLQHTYLHDLPAEAIGGVDLSVHAVDFLKPVASRAPAHAFRCQLCGYDAPNKRLITKHVKTAHGSRTANQNVKGLPPVTKKPRELLPKVRNRVTRNAVRDMRWLSQDCLSLPGREFLDKYCSLSAPERTLEETQQFLVRSTVGETDDQKWTKALQSVLSNFPQDIGVHPMLDNAMMSASGKDLTVLMVQNKIKVPQNAGSYVKRTTPAEKLESSPSASAALDAHCVVDPSRGQPHVGGDQTHCQGTQNNLNEDSPVTTQPESAESGQIQENRENQELRLHQNVEDHGRKCEEAKHDHSYEDGVDASKEPKSVSRRDNRVLAQRRNRSRRGRRRLKTRPNALDKRLHQLGLKLVLKKDPVKSKQWMSHSSVLPPETAVACDQRGSPQSQATLEERQLVLDAVPFAENGLREDGDAPESDARGAADSVTLESEPRAVEGFSSETHKQPCSSSGDHRGAISVRPEPDCGPATTTGGPINVRPRLSAGDGGPSGENESGMDCSVSGEKESSTSGDVDPLRNNGAISSQVAITSIIPLGSGSTLSQDPGLPVYPLEMRDPTASGDNESPGPTPSEEPSTASACLCWPAPRYAEKTLKLTPMRSSQPVKRPLGEQPVVVLNHPDADLPEVTRIMEAVHRHRGDVQRVVLSRQTLGAISALDGPAGHSTGTPAPPAAAPACRANPVRERFMLKLRLKRTSRRKYQVVRTVSDGCGPVVKFRCWFCGRAFISQDVWIAHRQRHFMEWKRPNCEEP